jgi:hypothetical protein
LAFSSHSRVYIEQVETMQKLKGKAGQQRVIVEHVTVGPGGKAFVGAIGGLIPGGPGAEGGNVQ